MASKVAYWLPQFYKIHLRFLEFLDNICSCETIPRISCFSLFSKPHIKIGDWPSDNVGILRS